jgi:hypothetical protein
MKIKSLALIVGCLALALATTSHAAYYVTVTIPESSLLGSTCNCGSLTPVQSSTAYFGLFGQTSGPGTSGQLTCNVFQGTGAAGSPFYVYEYQVEAGALGTAANHCLSFDLLDLGATPLSWDFASNGHLEQVFNLGDTLNGNVPVFFSSDNGSDLNFLFGSFANECGLVPGNNSYVFGFISHTAPILVTAQVVDTYTDPQVGHSVDYAAKVQTYGPDFCYYLPPHACVLPNPFNPGMFMQALLLGTNGAPAPGGMIPMQFQLFDSPTNGTPVSGIITQVENVVNGLFTAKLDFGPNSFHPPNPCFLDVILNPPGVPGPIHLMPRLMLGQSPYAAHADLADGVVALGSGQAVTSLNGLQDQIMLMAGTNVSITPTNNALVLSALGVGPASITPTQLATPAPPTDGQVLGYMSGVLQWQNACACPISFWNLNGNANTTPANFVGTTDNQALNLDSDSHRGLQLQYLSRSSAGPPVSTTYAMNVLGGYWGNAIANNILGATIAGGGELFVSVGAVSTPNVVTADFGTIGGGLGNASGGNASTIAGGNSNTNNADNSSIGGGIQNTIQTNQVACTIAGGDLNLIGTNASYSIIGGGQQNQIGTNATQSTIAGGYKNTVMSFPNATAAFIGGGSQNTIGGGGGGFSAANNMIGGGSQNIISSGSSCVVSGGTLNEAGGSTSPTAPGASYATVGGGFQNTASGSYSTVPGGSLNIASGQYSFAAGHGAQAVNDSSFVWSDGLSPTYTSDTANQFKVQAHGGLVFDAAGGVVMNVSGSSGLYPAALRINSTSANGVGLAVGQNSSDATVVLGNSSDNGHLLKGFGYNGTQVFLLDDFGGVTFGNTSEGINGQVSWGIGQGSWSFSSDRNLKERFCSVDPVSILDKVASLPLSEWSYNGCSQRHIGPMAQDFHDLFPLNPDDKMINDLDLHGVALAAIQGVNSKLEDQKVEIKVIKARDSEIDQKLEVLRLEIRARDTEIELLRKRLAVTNQAMNERLATLEKAVNSMGMEATPKSVKASYKNPNEQ